jgi:DNA polymerase-3 subunit alpha
MHSLLATRTTFSIGESILTIEKLIENGQRVEAKAIAITDTMSVTAMIDFTNKAKKAGIKPIVGCRLRLVDDVTLRKEKGEKWKAPDEFFVTYYVLSEDGLKALFRLLTLANSESHYYYSPRISFDDLQNELDKLTPNDAVIASSDAQSVVSHKDASTLLENMKRALSASNVFLSLTPINTPYWDRLNKESLILADSLGLPTLVTRPVLYGIGEADAADVAHAISKNNKLSEMWALSPASRNHHPMSSVELIGEVKTTIARLRKVYGVDSAKAFQSGLRNTDILVDMVKYEWAKQKPSLPIMSADEFASVVEECKKGWPIRFNQETFGHKPTEDELRDIYKPRLAYELSVLKNLKFSGYFLLVQDVVQFAKRSGILVGPGRGSVGGSLVAYLMGITDCDPIRFGLLFERFINPDRLDLPDADLDFMSERRHEIVDYLVTKYGRDRVAGVSNFGTLATASAIRDVGKVCGLSEEQVRCSKFAPKNHGLNIKLEKSADMVPEIAEFRDTYPPIWDIALKLEGSMRNLSQHAAGVVVSGCDLVERAVIERRKDVSVVCWDKRIVEDQGLIKMDILGLSTLDLINLTLKFIRERHSKTVDLMRIPLNDEKVLDNFANAITTGIFQFESGGMRRLLKELGKNGGITFEDITAATALYRPGPMESGMMDSYFKRKQGEEDVQYDHPLMKPILQPTYGVMVYQEQIMQVSRVIAGYSAPDADKLRKIMGKKLPEEMAKERGKFVEGCVKTVGAKEEWAGELFDKIEGFAGYGFNKSHSVEYTLISYQSMWLKTFYPVEFIAAALSLMDEDKLAGILKDASRLGVKVLTPDINLSTDRFEILNDDTLSIPFNRIKGISSTTTNAILEARKAGPFKSIEDLTDRVERRKCNVRHTELLNKVGAFARIEPGQAASNSPTRLKDQIELIPGLITGVVPILRSINKDKHTKAKLGEVIQKYTEDDETTGVKHVKFTMGKRASFMVITDGPSSGEAKTGQFTFGDNFGTIFTALREAGLERADGYWTGLIKQPKEGKQVSPAETAEGLPILLKEIELLKPTLIVLMGSTVTRVFFPDLKGKAFDSAGKIKYFPEYDANVMIGFNSQEIFYDPDKQMTLNDMFARVASIIE